MKKQRVSLWIVVVFAVVLSFFTALRAAPVRGQGQRIGPGQVPAGLAAEDWDRILAQLPAGYDETNKLSASDAGAGDGFGWSVAISGDTLVVGAFEADGGPGDPIPESGAAYVFERDLGGAGNWGEAAKLSASDAGRFDYFGWSVAISGDTLVVGARYEDGGPGDPLDDSGAAYVYQAVQLDMSIHLPVVLRQP